MLTETAAPRQPLATLPTFQQVREDRAREQRGNYSFRLTSVNGTALVYVTNHTPDGHGNCAIYSVSGDRCNCGDFIHRCSKTPGLGCKHVLMVREWLADCSTPELPEPAEAPIVLPVISEPTAEEAARLERARRERAILWP